MTVPQTAVQAATDARTALVRASLTLPVNAADLRTKAGALATNERTLAVARATELTRIGGANLKLSSEQLAAIVANNGLPRGGNTSPGGTFEYGDYTGGPRLVTEETKAEMKRILEEIQDGRYAADWIKENRTGRAWFESTRAGEQQHPIEKVGKELRKMMPFLDAVEAPTLEPAK